MGDFGRIRFGLVAAALVLAGCGGSSSEAVPCPGVEARGICWVGEEGISLSQDRAERVFDVARAFWGTPTADLSGWRVELRRAQPVVAGEPYAGYCFAASRLVVVAPFAPDCFERSAIFHELGHAWGFGHDDPRMFGEWAPIHEAMVESRWRGCEVEEGED